MKDKRVVFMGTPNFSVPVLKNLIENTNVVLVVTKEDALVGRKKILTPSPVKETAMQESIPVLTPKSLKESTDEILSYKPDVIITCAFGKIVPKSILDYPKYGCINVHASLLPKYRGASPINKAIENGEKYTGVTIMYMDESLDTGDIITSERIEIEDQDNFGSLTEKLSVLGSNLLIKTLPKIFDGTNERIKQDEELATYVSVLKKEDEKLSFSKSVLEVHNYIRSLSPSPAVFITLDGETIKVLESKIGYKKEVKETGIIDIVEKDYIGITCLDGIIELTKVKRAGKNEMSVKDFLNGYKGELLGKKVD